MRRLLGCVGILVASVATGGEEQKAAPPERPPGLVLGYTKDGHGSIRGICIDAGRNAIACDFVESYFMPPSKEQADKGEREILDSFKKDPEAAKEVVQARAMFSAVNAEVAKTRLGGPKWGREFADMTKALASGDSSRIAHAFVEHERHTCKLITQAWTAKFHRIGTRKWASDAEPVGPCRVVTGVKLSSNDPSSLLWKVKRRTVSVGETANALCKAKTVGELDEWAYAPKEYELPCDFVAYGP